MARVSNQSVKNIILADQIEVRESSEFKGMFYIATIHAERVCVVSDTEYLAKFFPNEATAWRFVKRYRDLDQPGLVD